MINIFIKKLGAPTFENRGSDIEFLVNYLKSCVQPSIQELARVELSVQQTQQLSSSIDTALATDKRFLYLTQYSSILLDRQELGHSLAPFTSSVKPHKV